MNPATIGLLCLASFLLGILIALRFAGWALRKEALNLELQRLFLLDAALPVRDEDGRTEA